MSTDHAAIILLYHRVADLPTDPQALAVSPRRFGEHLAALKRVGTIIPLPELVRGITTGRLADRAIAITFDDGYVDNLALAAPMLRRHAAPATFYITARGPHAAHREFWWDDLERLLLHDRPLPERLSLDIAGRRHEWSLPDVNAAPRVDPAWNVLMARPPLPREGLYLFLAKLLRPLAEVSRRPVLDELARWAGLPATGRPTYCTLNEGELRELAADDLFEIGAHSVTHPVLGLLPRDEQRAEILESRRRLEQIIGRTVNSFAYPFGCRADFTETTVNIVRDAGLHFACANSGRPPATRSRVTAAAELHRLPRAVVRHVDAIDLAQSVSRAFEAAETTLART